MANRPARPCLHPGCPAVTRSGSRCPAHQLTSNRQRGSSTQRGYGSEWQRTRLAILNRDGWVCGYCGSPATTVDHVTPKARGGPDDEANLMAACLSCNSGKRDR
jgi:5-methylcytosine-specific restriction protein A